MLIIGLFRIRNPVYGYAVTWVRIPPSPPSVCPIRDRDSIGILNRAQWARFCVLGSELLRGHEPTIARFPAEVSGRELREFGARALQFAVVKRLAAVSAPGRGDVRLSRHRRITFCWGLSGLPLIRKSTIVSSGRGDSSRRLKPATIEFQDANFRP